LQAKRHSRRICIAQPFHLPHIQLV